MKKLATLAVGLVTLTFSVFAAEPLLDPSQIQPVKQPDGLYIVQMSEFPAIAYEGNRAGYVATKPGKGKKLNPNSAHVKKYVARLDADHTEALQSVGGAGSKIYDYRYTFNGFAARLSAAQVEQLKSRSDVVRVWENEIRQLTTNTSPAFIGLTAGGEPWSKGYTGEDVIIGVIDTGIWPEHPSLADVPTSKKGNKGPLIPYGPPPAGWSGTACEFGNTSFNPNDAAFTCNNKLLGAQYYNQSFPPASLCGGGNQTCNWTEFLSARDNDGHGSHTATTAGGNNGVPASIGGDPLGTVSGMAPRARIAVYKICWNGSLTTTTPRGCGSGDAMAAIDQAVADGVDVINYSIGGAGTTFNGPDDVAFLFAADAGVFVATSAGNTGSAPQTIGTPSGVPWITTVAAAQDDQVFGVGVGISTSAPGVSGTYEGIEAAFSVPLATSGTVSGDLVLANPLNGCAAQPDMTGKIALIVRGACGFTVKFANAQAANAAAVIVFNNAGDPIVMGGTDPTIAIPGVMVSQSAGTLFANTITGGDAILATLDPSVTVPKVNTIASFSSRGPNGGSPDIIKPDVSAPGVAILAAETPDGNDGQVQGELFQSINGTSMSSPHVAGVFALLKQAHPDWTPAMARSAIMTTARSNMKKSFGDAPADPFDTGSGFIVPGKAFDPGLAYDADIVDYVQFTCGSETQPPIFTQGTCNFFGSIDSSDLNLPSIGIGALVGSQTVTRTVTSVANNNGNKSYTVSVDAPPGINVSVSPTQIKLKPGQSATYQVTFSTTSASVLDQWAFGSLTWSHGGEYAVRSPIAVRPGAFNAPDNAGGSGGADGSVSYDVAFGYDGDFEATMDGLAEGVGVPGAIADADVDQIVFVIPAGTTLSRFALYDSEVGAQNDLDLQVYGPQSAGFPLACSSGTATSEEQCDLSNPVPGVYVAVVFDFATDPGPTAYTMWNFNLDGADSGNTVITAPTQAVTGTTGQVTINWTGLTTPGRALGIVSYNDGVDALGDQTEVLIVTQ